MDEEVYQAAVDKVRKDYGSRIFHLLADIGHAAERRGWLWSGTVNEQTFFDDYRWQITVEPRTGPKVDFTFIIEESVQHEGTTDGINFVLEACDHDGHDLGRIAPYNYTSAVWVDPRNAREIEERFRLIERNSSEFANELPLQKRDRHRIQRATAPHGRCTLDSCVEHTRDKSVPRCKSRSHTESVVCASGTTGWESRLRDNYNNDFERFESYCDTYNIAERLGFCDAQEAWEENPIIQGSTNPADLRVVRPQERASIGSRRKSSRKRKSAS